MEARFSISPEGFQQRSRPDDLGQKMTYKATIKTADNGAIIQKAFAAEDRQIKEKASYNVEKAGKGAIFQIEAKDSTSLRAILNSITKILTVIEKMRKI